MSEGSQLPMTTFVGTPLIPKREAELRKSQVQDQQGRSRFHGAFEGGFSAGYYNTVGSAQGWQPSQYVRGKTLRAEDYMDEEDDALLGDRISAKAEFIDPLGEDRIRFGSENAWGDPSTSVIPGPIPRELLWFSEKPSGASSSSSTNNDESSLGKRLYLLCCSNASRRQKFMAQESDNDRKQAPLLVGTHGLGYEKPSHALLSRGSNKNPEAREIVQWKKSQRDDSAYRYDYEEAEENTPFAKSELAFEVVDVDDFDEDTSQSREAKADHMASRILNKEVKSSKELWPDGVRIPSGFTLAKRHDPYKFLKAKKTACTSVSSSVSAVHDFGAFRPPSAPMVSGSKNQSNSQPLLKSEDAKAVLASRFTVAGKMSSTYAANSNGRSDLFVRTLTTWVVSEATKKAFGLLTRANATSTASNAVVGQNADADGEPVLGTVSQPSMAEFRKVLGRHRDDEEEFVSSGDSEREEAEESESSRRSRRRSRSRSRRSSSDTSSVSSRRLRSDKSRKSRKSSKHRKHKHKRRHRSRRSRSPSSVSSPSSRKS